LGSSCIDHVKINFLNNNLGDRVTTENWRLHNTPSKSTVFKYRVVVVPIVDNSAKASNSQPIFFCFVGGCYSRGEGNPLTCNVLNSFSHAWEHLCQQHKVDGPREDPAGECCNHLPTMQQLTVYQSDVAASIKSMVGWEYWDVHSPISALCG
jgi:hypothetical protein